MAQKVKICETILRDAHQSLIATRMSMDEMLPILPAMDEVGFYSCECWGGATFDSCIRFLSEDPWERLRLIRKNMPNTKLQMLFRGQNMLGYRHYADDAVEYFVKKSVDNGIDIIRIFDALNDIRNLETAIKATKKTGAHMQAAISYTLSPVHSIEYFVNYAKQLEDAGADSICIKDMAALITPAAAFELTTELKKAMVAALQGTPYDTGLDLKKLDVVRAHFAKLRQKYLDSGLLSPKVMGVDANTLTYQVPGGMLSNLVSQLKQAGKEDKFEDVLKEVPNVRKDSGYPPLVTPTSQIVGTQAVFNVILGERYKMVTKEFKAMVKGEYGRTPAPIDPAFRKKILGDEAPIECRPADLIPPELDKLRAEFPREFYEQEEDVLTMAMFPQVAPKFFEARRDKKYGVDSHGDKENKVHPV